MTRRLRVGAVGAGWWATTNHFPILAARDDVDLVAVSSINADHESALRTAFGFELFTTDPLAVLDAGIDAVLVATPHHVHHEHAAAALDRGLAVLIEKPMTLRAADAWDLVARA